MSIIQMGYTHEAFGKPDPRTDPDAAVKFCLDIVAMDRRFRQLAELLRDESDFCGFGGDPCWTLSRRRGVDVTSSDEAWPTGAVFHASEFDYQFTFPQGYYTATAFFVFVRAILRAYVGRHPDRASEAAHVACFLKE